MKFLLQYPNVIGFGTGFKYVGGEKTDQICVSVLVSKKLPGVALRPEDIIPSRIGLSGMRVTDVVEVGVIRALKERTDRWRPAPPGVSIGHYAITAGTFGCVVRKDGERFILSNNHVLANQNNAQIGDEIYQPGAYDGGTELIARLEDFVPIEFGGGVIPPCPFANGVANAANWMAQAVGSSVRLRPYRDAQQADNLVDAAIARPLSDNLIVDEILEIGEPTGSAEVSLGESVKKSGRTTGLTEGTVAVIDATVQVQYSGAIATFEEQIITTNMSEPGDSGSVLVNQSHEAVGLLFAGSDQSTIHSPFYHVMDLLGVTV